MLASKYYFTLDENYHKVVLFCLSSCGLTCFRVVAVFDYCFVLIVVVFFSHFSCNECYKAWALLQGLILSYKLLDICSFSCNIYKKKCF